MSEELIEKIAKAIKHQLGPHFLSPSSYSDLARAALAAIEASGTHVVVPVKPTLDMTRAAYATKEKYNYATLDFDIYVAMLSARPKVTE